MRVVRSSIILLDTNDSTPEFIDLDDEYVCQCCYDACKPSIANKGKYGIMFRSITGNHMHSQFKPQFQMSLQELKIKLDMLGVTQ